MRILIVSGYSYWGDFIPTDLDSEERQIAGGETSMISIAEQLAALGNEVIVFYDIERNSFGKYNGVDYLPTELYVPVAIKLEHDVLLAWDAPHAFRYNTKSGMRALAFQLNNAEIGVYDHVIDLYLHPSQWHVDRFCKLYPEMDKSKCQARVTNGVNYERYTSQYEKGGRNPKRVVYSSSPDRGLHHLLDLWPIVVEQVPDAELHVYYEMDRWLNESQRLASKGFETITSNRARTLTAQITNGIPNTHFHGGIGQKALARAQLSSGVLAYPCDPIQPTEGFSMTILEGIVAGMNVITTDADALGELWGSSPGVTVLPLPIDKATWVDKLVSVLNEPVNDEVRYHSEYSWVKVGQKVERLLRQYLRSK